jgi:hypothetical protein
MVGRSTPLNLLSYGTPHGGGLIWNDYGNTKCETAERNFTTRPPVELTCLRTLREHCPIFALTPSMGFDRKARLGPRPPRRLS